MKTPTVLLLLCLLIFSCFSINHIQATGVAYYVSTTGSDTTGTGTLLNPYKTIQKAVNVSGVNDSVVIRGGTYTPAKNIQIGSKNYLTIRNYTGEHVIINGTNTPTTNYINATIELKTSNHIRITGLTIERSRLGGITIRTKPCSFICVDNCSIKNCSEFAIKANNGLNNITFEHNYVYNCFNNWSSLVMSQETVSFENITTFSINNNTIINSRTLNIDMKGGCKHGKCCYNRINTTADYLWKYSGPEYGSAGIYIDARGVSSNISIYNNNVWGNNTGLDINTETTGHFEYIYIYNNIVNLTGYGAAGASGRFPMIIGNSGLSTDIFHHVYIYDNTFIDDTYNNYSMMWVGHWTLNQLNKSDLHYVYIVNNIFYSKSISASFYFWTINKISYSEGSFIIRNNSFYRPTGTIRVYWNGTTYTSSGDPSKFGVGPLFTNPKFASPNSIEDFNLNSTSPCINVGNVTYSSSTDYDNLSRPQGAKSDIGAYEYYAGPYYASPTGDDIGPGIPWKPFLTIQHTINITANKGVLYLITGTYTTPNLNVTVGKEVHIKAYNGIVRIN